MSASSRPVADAVGGKAERQVDRGGRFADAALARGDGDDVLHARHVDAAAAAGRLGAGAVAVAVRVALAGAAAAAAGRSAVMTAVADSTPGMARTACSQAWRSGSSAAPRAGSTSRVTATCPPRVATPLTMPSATTFLPVAGSMTVSRTLAHGRFGDFRHVACFRRPGNIVSPLD